MPDYDDKSYSSIIPTAYVTAYPRIFTDIPYWPEIFTALEELLAEENSPAVGFESKVDCLAPELEARYLLIDKLLKESGIKQVLELASGLSPRGLLESNDPSIQYVELDLPDMAKMKLKILSKITKSIPDNLHVIGGNALRTLDMEKAVSSFDVSRPAAVLHEGLMRYLSFEEKAQLAKNIKLLLQRFGGVWITCDTTPKKLLSTQDATSPGFNKSLIEQTGKNFYENMFENEEHVVSFFGDLGFSVEIHKFDEVADRLTSPTRLGFSDKEAGDLIESGTVAVMRPI